MVKMIFAVGPNGEFGNGSGLPWDVPEDLVVFKEYTQGYPMIMSGATFASLPGKLPGRKHYVVGRPETCAKNGAKPDYLLSQDVSLGSVCELLDGHACIIGGRDFLEQGSLICDSASVTCILGSEVGDADIYLDDEIILDNLNKRMKFEGATDYDKFSVLRWSL